jgi:hypothetical protein
MNRESLIYTSSILNSLYSLTSKDIVNGFSRSYVGKYVNAYDENFIIGLYNKELKYHILEPQEIQILDLLLHWYKVVDRNSVYAEITFEDIDWIRDRNKYNKLHKQRAHEIYELAIRNLNELYLIYGNEKEYLSCEVALNTELKLIDIEYDSKTKGIRYKPNKILKQIDEDNQLILIPYNIYKYKYEENIKYQLFRYLATSIFMNRVKSKICKRTHSSILRAIVCNNGEETATYYENIMDASYPGKYLLRYFNRLDEVLNILKNSEMIEDYKIVRIKNIRELKMGMGYVEIKHRCIKRHR